MELPLGFVGHVGNIGIKDDLPDIMLLASTDQPAAAAAVFTRSIFSGPSVTLSRKHIADGSAQAVVIASRNANVATGPQGATDAAELAELTAAACGCASSDVIVGSTGIIGVPYPMQKVRDYFGALTPGALTSGAPAKPDLDGAPAISAEDLASAIMTTDTHPKTSHAQAGPARVVGIAKGVGMIEPDMATMLAVITTDAASPAAALDAMFGRVVARTFNALSIDTDTSTSDMAVVLASGAAGPVEPDALEAALLEVCTDLTRQLAADGEGAETLIVVTVDQAYDEPQAKRVAKAIVNSPLVKTAVHGSDPNWGRVAMAIGKCYESDGAESASGEAITPEEVVIRFGEQEVFPTPATPEALAQLGDYLSQDEVLIHVTLGTGDAAFTVYGCDLTDGYVRINADYTT